MLTKLICRNFKRFGEIEVELGNPVVFIGPNNSGKTTALQALTLWDIGLKRWNEHRKGRPKQKSDRALPSTGAISSPSLCRMQGCSGEICRSGMCRELMVSNRRKTSVWILSLKALPLAGSGNVVWNSIMPIRNPFTADPCDYQKGRVED